MVPCKGLGLVINRYYVLIFRYLDLEYLKRVQTFQLLNTKTCPDEDGLYENRSSYWPAFFYDLINKICQSGEQAVLQTPNCP
jgi:hypothetical protein